MEPRGTTGRGSSAVLLASLIAGGLRSRPKTAKAPAKAKPQGPGDGGTKRPAPSNVVQLDAARHSVKSWLDKATVAGEMRGGETLKAHKRYAGRMAKDMTAAELREILTDFLGNAAVVQRFSTVSSASLPCLPCLPCMPFSPSAERHERRQQGALLPIPRGPGSGISVLRKEKPSSESKLRSYATEQEAAVASPSAGGVGAAAAHVHLIPLGWT
jgi:hypothetical protein